MGNKTPWIVELQDDVWLADGCGDPPRTVVKENARQFPNFNSAKKALAVVRREFPRKGFKQARIY